jgi:hypothetical protein
MLILLGLSTLAAALVPPRSLEQGTDETTATTATEPAETATVPFSDIVGVQFVIKVGPKEAPIKVVPLKPGQQLALTVRSDRTGLLEIPAIGRFEPVSPDTSAYFNLLLPATGSYAINFIGTGLTRGRLVARIEVGKVNPAGAPAEPGKAR